MQFMQWFKLYADLKDHPKRWRFEELADTEYGLHYLTAWFSYVCKYAPGGNVSGFTPREVARACEWKGDPQRLWDALVGAGFIDQDENGALAHDWYEENARFINENSKRKEPKGYPRVSQGLPVLQDKTGQDKTGHKTLAVAAATEPVVAPSKKKPDHKGFEEFYAAYPRHDAKADALKAWNQVQPGIDDVLEAIRWQLKSQDHLDKEKRFIPLPATWLRGRRWLDEAPAAFKRKERFEATVPQAPTCEHTDVSTTEVFVCGEHGLELHLTDTCKCGQSWPTTIYTKESLEDSIKMMPTLQVPRVLLKKLQDQEGKL